MNNIMTDPSMNAAHINSEILIATARERFFKVILFTESLSIWLESLRFLYLVMGYDNTSHDRLNRATTHISKYSAKEARG